uniref:Interleukin 18 receptor 1 n=3 Tax=Nothobranchius kadleci TaxID=1051664 RepID=A0A1A8C3D5_NOTKA
MAVLQLLFLTFITGVCSQTPKDIYVKAGEMVTLHSEVCKVNDTATLWKQETDQTIYVYSNMSAAEQKRMGVVLYKNCLVILRASGNHTGNYSCHYLRRNHSQRFTLTVYTPQSKEYDEKNRFSDLCYTPGSCQMFCPSVNTPPKDFKPNGTTWHTENGEPSSGYFSSVEEKDSGVYICTRSYAYSGQIYNMTFTVILDVQREKPVKNLGISFPNDGQVFEVEVGKRAEIPCKALTDSTLDPGSPFWLSGSSFVEEDNRNARVYFSFSFDNRTEQMTATLTFKEVKEEDLSTKFTCKLESEIKPAFATITLTKIAQPSYTALAVCSIVVVLVMVLTVVVYSKFKVDITLFFRDALGCRSITSDGRSYDAFLMCYMSDTDKGLNEDDRRQLENTLEERFGYTLCLYDRDILPGQAVAETVLESTEQSRAVVLVPCSSDPGPGIGLLGAIHEALVERKTRLILINTKQTEGSKSDSLPEALQLLSKAGDCVTWKGSPPSSTFWKELRYHLPAPQHAPRRTHRLLSQTGYEVPSL